MVLLMPALSFGQYQFRALNQVSSLKTDTRLYQNTSTLHTAIRPLDTRSWADTEDSTLSTYPPQEKSESWWKRKFFLEHLVEVQEKDYSIFIDPIVNLQLGFEANESYRYINTRGYRLEGRIKKNLSFYSVFLENQGRFQDYITNYAAARRVILGQSSLTRGFGDGGFDYTFFSGEVSYRPSETFTFTFGQGRNFIGEGYRSMLLSDAAFSYPFFRIQTNLWKFKYLNLWAQLNDPRREAQVSQGLLARKYMSTHFLSINLSPRWNFGIFESIIFGDTSQLQSLDVSFFNPVVLYRPVEFAVGSRSGNALMGVHSSYLFSKARMVYGQFLLDEFNLGAILSNSGDWVNKFGWQLGYKDYNAFEIEGLFYRLEYNAARPFTYSHREVLTNYAHYGSALAHPWGANFHEVLLQSTYQNKKWEVDLQFSYGLIGNDSLGENYGTNLYLSYETRQMDLGNGIGQGRTGNYLYMHARLAYLVNPASGLKAEIGLRYRSFRNEQSNINNGPFWEGAGALVFIGLRTELYNQYFDY